MAEFSQLASEIVERHQKNLADRTLLDSQLEEIRRFIDPFLPSFTTTLTTGEALPPRIDDTAVDAAEKYASAIHRAMTPAALAWVQLAHLDPQWEDDWEMRSRLSNAELVLQNGLDASNFQSEIQPFWRSYATAGTALLDVVDWDNRGRFHFSSYTINGVSLFDDELGICNARGREVEMTARQMARRGWDLPLTVREKLTAQKQDEKFKVLHWIGPDEDFQVSRFGGKKYVSLFILVDKERHVLNANGSQLEGFEEFPTFVGRHTRVVQDNLGRSRAFTILARVKELNTVAWYWRQGIKVALMGFYKNKEGNQWTSKTGDPHTIDGGDVVNFEDPDAFQPMSSPFNYGLGFPELESRKKEIRDHFFYNILNQRMDKYNMTQMEVMQAQRQEADTLAQQLSNGYNDVLVPMIERLIQIKMRAGEIERPRVAMAVAV